MPMNRPSQSLVVAVTLLFAACGTDDANRAATTGTGGAEPATAEAPAPGATTASRGSGTLRLGQTTYPFEVRICDLSGETDDMYQTMSGRGTTPEGESFDIHASRNDAGGMLVHTVSFQRGDVLRGAGTVYEAQRMRHGDAWMDMEGRPAEPLIRIDGNQITATGTFAPTDPGAGSAQDGEVQATCP
jgi:hypothetical protein